MSEPTRTYTNDGLTVEWRPELCTHCEDCYASLPTVFNPNRRPWVDLTRAPSKEVIETVKNCPSGALKVKE
jgi:uncharacterized Fe-S cluster protein YjdI